MKPLFFTWIGLVLLALVVSIIKGLSTILIGILAAEAVFLILGWIYIVKPDLPK